MTALIQIVDTNDRPVRAATKQEAWDKGLLHRVVRIMLEGPDGRILLQQRSSTKDLFPNCWDNSCAGHVDAGEDYKTAARRELQEELGLSDIELAESGRYFMAGEAQGHKTNRFMVFYKGKIDELPQRLETGKVDDVGWFSLAEVKQLIKEHPDQVSDGLVEVIERYYTDPKLGAHPPVVIVDDQDQPITEADLRAAWDIGLIHRIVRVMVEDAEGNMLLQRRSKNVQLFPNMWDHSAAGHVDAGEDYDQAAVRELREELGIENVSLQRVAVFSTDSTVEGRRLNRFNVLYRVIVPRDQPLSIDEKEVSEARWFSQEELKSLVSDHPEDATSGLIQVLEDYYWK